jgi:hypothetical protein
MATNRPGTAKGALGQQQAAVRREAPGAKRFIGGTAQQSRAAHEAERRLVARMAEVDDARRVADELGTPLAAVVAELVQDAVRLVRSLALAPFRIGQALLRRPRTT